MLEIKDLEVQYQDNLVLYQLNLKIEEGEVFGVLGKNGAGKTSLFESIFQSKSYRGEILYQGKKIHRSSISYLESENYFYPYITGKEYLHYFSTPENENKIQSLTTQFLLPLNRYIQDYSTGMKKKIALIAILLQDKSLCILDEPFNGVDFEGVHHLYQVIEGLKNEKKTVIITSHIIETLFHTCDKIGILENGKISKIFAKEQFSELQGFAF